MAIKKIKNQQTKVEKKRTNETVNQLNNQKKIATKKNLSHEKKLLNSDQNFVAMKIIAHTHTDIQNRHFSCHHHPLNFFSFTFGMQTVKNEKNEKKKFEHNFRYAAAFSCVCG